MVAILCRFKSCYPHQTERHPKGCLFCFAPLAFCGGRRGISTAFGRELLPAGWLPGRWAFSPSRLRVTGWGTSTALECELLPAGAKNFSPLQNRPVSLERTRAGASGGRGAHDGTGLSGSGAFSAKIDRCFRERLSPFFRFRSRKIHGKIFAEPRTDRTEPAGSEPAIRKIRER